MDAEREKRLPVTQEEFVESVRGTSYDGIFDSEEKLDALMYEEMSKSDDRMVSEIGRGLADGSMTIRGLTGSSVYTDALDRGLDSVSNTDPRAVFDALAAEKEACGDAPRRTGGPGADRGR